MYASFDETNHIKALCSLQNDEFYFQVNTEIDDKYMSAYQIVDDELVIDEIKLAEIKAKEKQVEKELEITRLKQELSNTDYKAIKYSEGWFTDEEYAPIKAMREDLRNKIRLLEDN